MDQVDKTITKLNKLSLPTVILIASLIIGGFYYASEVSKQNSIERQQQFKVEQEKQQQLEEQQKNEKNKQALNTCLADAEEGYGNNWFRECKSQGKLTNRCISLHDMTLAAYAEEKNVPDDKQFTVFSDFYKEKSDCSCRLPLDNADRLNKALQENKDECFKRYPKN